MNAVAAAAQPSRRLHIAVAAADPTVAARLASLVAAAGHELVADAERADAVLTDGSAEPLPGIPIVALGAIGDAFAGTLPVDAGPAQVDAALRAVVAGLCVQPGRRQQDAFAALPDGSAPLLTPREVEVLTALANGLSNKAAARQLGISPHTVKFHIEQLFGKLGAGNRAEAVAKGLKQQIVEL